MKFRGWLAIYLLTLFAALPSAAQPAARPWELTPQEHAAARRAAVRAENRGGVVTITARANPEAIFPSELFRHLVRFYVVPTGADPRLQAVVRDGLFLDDANWSALRRLTQQYAEILQTSDTGDATRKKEIRTALRDAERKALRDARKVFGTERFDAYLYNVVGKGFFVSYPNAPGEQHFLDLVAAEEAVP